MSGKESTERHDIFNPRYKKKQSFTRKTNLYRLIVIITLITVFIWGSRDFIYGSITYLEIQDIYHRPVPRAYLTSANYTGYFLYNRASYSIKLNIECGAWDFKTSYNNTVLIPNQILYISFTGKVIRDTEITIKGVKID